MPIVTTFGDGALALTRRGRNAGRGAANQDRVLFPGARSRAKLAREMTRMGKL